MNKLRVLIGVLVLGVTVVASGTVSVAPVAAADEVIGRATTKAEDIEVLRHHYFIYLKVTNIKGEATLARKSLNVDFLRHNIGTNPWTAKADVGSDVESAVERRTQDDDFLRHNLGAEQWGIKIDAGKSTQTQSDRQRIENGRTKR